MVLKLFELSKDIRSSLTSYSAQHLYMELRQEMTTILFVVLMLHSVPISTFLTSKCQDLRDTCEAAATCRSIWRLLKDVCCSAGKSYVGNESMKCHKTVEFLVSQFPEFKDCICMKNNCSTQILLDKECFHEKGKTDPPPGTDTQLKFLQQTDSPEKMNRGMLENDCSVAKEICLADDICLTRYKKFLTLCRAEVEKCGPYVVIQPCIMAWMELRNTILGNCTCPEPVHRRCSKIWQNIFNNTCLQYTRGYHSFAFSEKIHRLDTAHRKTKLQWQSSALSNYEYKHLRSCFQVNMDCVNDEVCNRQLSLYLQVCRGDGTQCNMYECQTALQLFYENMPFNVALMLTFCDCVQSDENCQKAKELLHGQRCADNTILKPSCLSVIMACRGSNLCWSKFEAFTSKCLTLTSQACLEDETCLKHFDTDRIVCSDSAECKDAYVGMWGSNLRGECTCETTTSLAEQLMCKRLHDILHSKSCFNQIAGGKADLNSSHLDLFGRMLPAVGERFLFYDDTVITIIYISCIAFILGIILLALLKTRACTTAYQLKATPPAHLSEKLKVLQ